MTTQQYTIAQHWDPSAIIKAGADPLAEFAIYKSCRDIDCGFTLEDFEKYIDSLNEDTQ